jgi:hypothetical protein
MIDTTPMGFHESMDSKLHAEQKLTPAQQQPVQEQPVQETNLTKREIIVYGYMLGRGPIFGLYPKLQKAIENKTLCLLGQSYPQGHLVCLPLINVKKSNIDQQFHAELLSLHPKQNKFVWSEDENFNVKRLIEFDQECQKWQEGTIQHKNALTSALAACGVNAHGEPDNIGWWKLTICNSMLPSLVKYGRIVYE